MNKPVIRIDTSRPFSTVHGDRQPDDPQYNVHFWQSYRHGKKNVLLPFDSFKVLIPDNGVKEPIQAVIDGKPGFYPPLYSQDMRDLVEKLESRLTKSGDEAPDGDASDQSHGEGDNPADAVNFASWLRGEAKYDWTALQAAAKARFGCVITSKKQMVIDLVLDEKLVPEDQVCDEFRKMLPAAQAA